MYLVYSGYFDADIEKSELQLIINLNKIDSLVVKNSNHIKTTDSIIFLHDSLKSLNLLLKDSISIEAFLINDEKIKNRAFKQQRQQLINTFNQNATIEMLRGYKNINQRLFEIFVEYVSKVTGCCAPNYSVVRTVYGDINLKITDVNYDFESLFPSLYKYDLEKVTSLKPLLITKDTLFISLQIEDTILRTFASPFVVTIKDLNNKIIISQIYNIKKFKNISTKQNYEDIKEIFPIIIKYIPKGKYQIEFGFFNQFSIENESYYPIFYCKETTFTK